ncbi:DUF58 domain-containing protein [Bacillus sp. 03113]|uniref:DUF58 domain-containing protein n=1 Tax=Bacillus sp. 03113 TaxID=2578211 RepID=UPI0011429E76|nr:DUF58 domain-containing protein [Bacillus sp. 03113]
MNQPHYLLSKLQKKRLIVKKKQTGLHKGLRKSTSFGSSLEFSDFRVYQPGDDVRQIDWNVFGRTQKHYIKRFLDEQEIFVSIFLDATSSMRAIQSKWMMAKQLAAALSFITLHHEDRLSFFPISSPSSYPIQKQGANQSRKVYQQIIQLTETMNTEGFSENTKQKIGKNQQLSILITDGMEKINEIESLLKKVGSRIQDVWFLQVMSQQELLPDFSGDVKLKDSETNAEVNVSVNQNLITAYQQRLQQHNKKLELLCLKYGITYLLVEDSKELSHLFFHEFPSKGLLN